jgi:hypothetical protein
LPGEPGYVVYLARVVPVVLLAVLFCCLVGTDVLVVHRQRRAGDGDGVPDRRGGLRAAAARVAGGGMQLSERAAAQVAY